MIAAIKVRSDTDARKKVKHTLENLSLEKVNSMRIMEDTESSRGMLQVAKDYITFGEVDEETVEMLENELDREISSGDVIELTPPSKGYSSTKMQKNQGGILGRNPEISELITRMV